MPSKSRVYSRGTSFGADGGVGGHNCHDYFKRTRERCCVACERLHILLGNRGKFKYLANLVKSIIHVDLEMGK